MSVNKVTVSPPLNSTLHTHTCCFTKEADTISVRLTCRAVDSLFVLTSLLVQQEISTTSRPPETKATFIHDLVSENVSGAAAAAAGGSQTDGGGGTAGSV